MAKVSLVLSLTSGDIRCSVVAPKLNFANPAHEWLWDFFVPAEENIFFRSSVLSPPKTPSL